MGEELIGVDPLVDPLVDRRTWSKEEAVAFEKHRHKNQTMQKKDFGV